MKKAMLAVLIYGLSNFLWSTSDMEKEFTKIYKEKVWGNSLLKQNFGGSGGGSTIHGTNDLRIFLIQFLKDHREIKTFLDVGCGEGVWQELIPWEELDVHYIGIDVVKELIEEQLKRSAHRTHMRFMFGEIIHDHLPSADLCFAKDVLQHWSLEHQIEFTERTQNQYPYLLVMNGYTSTNHVFEPKQLPNSTAQCLGDFTDSEELKKLFLIKPK